MSLRSQLILLFALVAGCLFAILFRMVFYDKPSGVEDIDTAGQKPPVPVIVAENNLEIGDELNAQNVRFEAFPEDMVAWDAITHFKDVKQRRLVRPVQKGHLISLLDLNDPEDDDGDEAIFIPPGYQPVPIEVSIPFSKSSDALPIVMGKFKVQDRVTLSIVLEDTQGSAVADGRPSQRKLMTTPICEDVEIYQVAVVQRRETFSAESRKVLVVTVLLSQDQMAQVFSAIKTGNLLIVPRAFPESEYSVISITGAEDFVSRPSSFSRTTTEKASSSPEKKQKDSSSDSSSNKEQTPTRSDDTFVQVSSSASVFMEASLEKPSPRPVPQGVFCPGSSPKTDSNLNDSIAEKDWEKSDPTEKEPEPIYASSKPLMGAPRHYEDDPVGFIPTVSAKSSSATASVRPVGLLRNADGTYYTGNSTPASSDVSKDEVKTTPRGVFAPRSSVNWRDYVVDNR